MINLETVAYYFLYKLPMAIVYIKRNHEWKVKDIYICNSKTDKDGWKM